jgi:hypothetical protein
MKLRRFHSCRLSLFLRKTVRHWKPVRKQPVEAPSEKWAFLKLPTEKRKQIMYVIII